MNIIESPFLPPGRFIIGQPLAVRTEPLRIERDPWPPTMLTGVAASERHRALDYLAALLDRTYLDLGLDPDLWRHARHREQDRNEYRMIATERVALHVQRPTAYVTGVS